jgi:proteic killer suppression protein
MATGQHDREFQAQGLAATLRGRQRRGVNAEHVRKLKQILAELHAAETIEAMRLPTFGLHALKGDLKRVLGRNRPRELADHLQVRRWQGV